MKNLAHIINTDIRPQDDLYRHVNDTWLRENTIPEEESRWSNFNELLEITRARLYSIIESLVERDDIEHGSVEQKVRDFYLSGSSDTQKIETAGVEKVLELFQVIDKSTDKESFANLMGRLHLMDINPLWAVGVDQDEVDSSQYLLRLHQSGLSLPARSYYDQRKKDMKYFRARLEEHIPRMFHAIGYGDSDADVGRSIYAFENKLAKRLRSTTELRDVEANYNKMSFSALETMTPAIDWANYFRALGIDPPASLSVDQPEVFRALNTFITETDAATLRQYLKWHVLRKLSPYMGERVAQANFEFYGTVLNGTPKIKPLWKRLLSAIDTSIGEAIGKLYIEVYFPPEAKQRMNVLVEDLKTAFADRIKNLVWMDPQTKSYALEKLDNTAVKIGYPEKMRTYEELDITPDSFIDNCINARIYESKRHLSKLGQPVDREEWSMTPATVNACFDPNLNKITFPAGILQPPFFDFEADDALNYGGIGAVIGHELTHGFDDMGSLFDADGNLRNWRSEKDKQAFDDRAQVLIEQADQYQVLDGYCLNGKLTLGENIADIGGANIAYQALGYGLERNGRPGKIDGFEPEERFFLNFARVWRNKIRDELALQFLLSDPHSPGEFRANNTVRNMDAFYTVFGVEQEDKQYLEPDKRVNIW